MAALLRALSTSDNYGLRVARTAVEFYVDFACGPELFDEVLAAVLSLDGRTVSVQGINFPMAAVKIRRTLTHRLGIKLINSVVYAMCVESKSPFLRRTAFLSNIYPTIQFFAFQRLYTTRALQWLGRKLIPTTFARKVLGFDASAKVGATSSGGGGALSSAAGSGSGLLEQPVYSNRGGEGITTASRSEAAHFEPYSPLETAQAYHGYVQSEGSLKAVVQTNFVEYATHLIVDQLVWANGYRTAKPGRCRAIFKTHVTSFVMTAAEIAVGVSVRALGSKIGAAVVKRNNGLGAFWGENGLYLVLSYPAALLVGAIGGRVYRTMERLLPADEAEIEMEREEEEELHQQQQQAHEQFQQQVAAADPGSEDLYKILDVAPTATTDEIKKAYHKKALAQHPDKLHGLAPAERERIAAEFKAVTHAKSILTNPEKRRDYDFMRTATKPPEFLLRLQRLPLSAKLVVSIGMVAASGSLLLFVFYAHSFMALKIFSQRGIGMMKMWQN